MGSSGKVLGSLEALPLEGLEVVLMEPLSQFSQEEAVIKG